MKLDRWCDKHLDAGGLAAVTKMFVILHMPSFVKELSSFKLLVFFLGGGVPPLWCIGHNDRYIC